MNTKVIEEKRHFVHNKIIIGKELFLQFNEPLAYYFSINIYSLFTSCPARLDFNNLSAIM